MNIPLEVEPAPPMSETDSVDIPLASLRVPGDTPEHDQFRTRLHACAVAGEADAAVEALDEMEAAGFAPTRDDHRLVLVAYQLRGRDEDAEVYLRALPWTMVTEAHLHAVLSAFAFNRRADEVERLYREFEACPVPPDDECRVVLLEALALIRDHQRAREWFDRFEYASASAVPPRMLSRLIDAHASPGSHDELVDLVESLDDELRGNPDVAVAVVFGFAAADDPERAETYLAPALEKVADPNVREAILLAVLRALRRRLRPAVARILALADEYDVDVEHRNLIERNELW